MADKKTIADLVLEFFHAHPNQDMTHGPVVDWVEAEYVNIYGKKPRDVWRQIRLFHQQGKLIKVGKGVYRYEPSKINNKDLFDFSQRTKREILKRDGYRCVVCRKGREDGIELCVDHIKPKDKGGDNFVSNGQTLCMEHNLMKKNYSQTETGKRYIVKLYERALSIGDQRIIDFCKCIFDCYDRHRINGHIPRPDKEVS